MIQPSSGANVRVISTIVKLRYFWVSVGLCSNRECLHGSNVYVLDTSKIQQFTQYLYDNDVSVFHSFIDYVTGNNK